MSPVRQTAIVALLLFTARCQAGMQVFVPSDPLHLHHDESKTLLQLICPGHTEASGCDVCPGGTSFNGGRWDLSAVIPGHFLSPQSDDMLLGGVGCEDHADLNGGSFLFTRSGNKWKLVNYAPARIAGDCKKVKSSDERDLLICRWSDQHFGIRDEFLYLLDPAVSNSDARKLNIFFNVSDSLHACTTINENGREVVESGKIVGVTFAKTSGVASVPLLIDADLGKAFLSEASLRDCAEHSKPGEELLQPRIRTVRQRFEFVFDGKSVTPALSNPRVKGFEAIPPQTNAIYPALLKARQSP